MKTFLSLILLCFIPAVLSAGEIIINPDNAVISAPKASNPAAQELKTHLELITRKTIPVMDAGKIRKGSYIFYIGKAPEGTSEKFKPEEARWKITPKAAYFYGDKNNGTLFAVYDFLENELGVRWPGGADIAFRKQNPIRVKNTEGKWIPELNKRGIRCAGKGENKEESLLWRRRMRAGEHDRPPFGHSFTQYWKRFSKTHPEYFAMRPDGVRAPVGAKVDANNAAEYHGPKDRAIAMCVSSDALVEQVLADWKKMRCPRYINLCENDALGKDSCHCPKCTALDVVPKQKTQWENWYADRYIHFANRVLTAAKKIRPDVKVSMYAYNATEQPPSREKPHPDLILGIVPTDFTMKGIQAYVGSWKKAGLNHFFYRPNRHHYYRLPDLPTGYEKHFFELWQYLYKSGAIGFDYDAPTGDSVFLYYRNYFLMKAMQDPSKSFEYWDKHYMQAFGAASEDVAKYFRYWREQVWDARVAPHQAELAEEGKWFNFARGLLYRIGDFYKESDFTKAGKHLEAALSRDLSPEERERIEKLKTANEHARLFFNAITKKTDEDSLKLLEFREKHQIPVLPSWQKQFYRRDICGIERVMAFRKYKPPFLKTPLFWYFRLDPENRGVKEKWYVDTPEQFRKWGAEMCTDTPWETPHKHYKRVSADIRKKTADYNGIAWYAAQLQIPAGWKGRKVFLHFGAVDESCWVYLNSKEIASRIYKNPDDWKTPFALQIDSGIDWKKKKQSVIIRVEDRSGKGGIWKPITLISK